MAALPDLARQDGVKLHRNGGEFKALCPFHAERTPSFTLFQRDGKWRFHCFGCDADGDDVDYLVKARGWSKKEALQHREGDGAAGPPAGRGSGVSKTQPAPQASPPAPAVKWFETLPDRYESRHVYRRADGKIAFVIQRYLIDGKKHPTPYTRARRGKGGPVLWANRLLLKAPRPLYRLPELLAADRTRQVMVVEGEKCADAVAKASKRAVVVTWAGGASAWRKTDFAPLHGRRLCLVADGNAVGHRCMAEIAAALADRCPDTIIVRPPLAAPGEKDRDIADEIAAGTDIAGWLRAHARPWAPEPPAPAEPPPAPRPASGINARLLFERLRVIERRGNRIVLEADGRRRVETSRRRMLAAGGLLRVIRDPRWWAVVLRAQKITAPGVEAVIKVLFRD